MKNNVLRALIVVIALALALSSFGVPGAKWEAHSQALTAPVLTGSLSDDKPVNADTALQWLKAGNQRWQRNEMEPRKWSEERKETSCGQHPFAVVIACMDSRVPPELIFDQGLGALFVIRVAGPVLNSDELASLEYALVLKKVKLVLVLGHTECGAVDGAVAKAQGPYLAGLLDKIEPAIRFVSDKYNHGERITTADEKNLMRVSLENARIVHSVIPTFAMPDVKVTWGLYYVDSGRAAIEPQDVNQEPVVCPKPKPLPR